MHARRACVRIQMVDHASRPRDRGRSCDLAASGRIALNTVVCAGSWMVGVGDVDSPVSIRQRRTVTPHLPMPLRWIGTVPGRPGNQRSSAWISGLPGFRAVRLAIRSRLGDWARFPAVASGLSCGTISGWLPLGIAWRRRCVGATMAKTACRWLGVGLFEPWDAAVTHEQSDGPKRR
jgi:hypothetical protein